MKADKNWRNIIFLIVLGIALTWVLTPGMVVTVSHSGDNDEVSDNVPVFPNNKPWYRAKNGELAFYHVSLNKTHPLQISTIHLLPDDCVKSVMVNGHNVYPNRMPPCRYGKGLSVDLSLYLQAGSNTLDIVVQNGSGTVGLDLYADFLGDSMGRWLTCYWLALWFFVVFLVAEQMRFSPPVKACLGLSMAMIIAGGMSMNYISLSQDLSAHIDHIMYLYTHWWRTDPFFHSGFRYPSLFHLLLAWLAKWGNALLLGGLSWKLCSLLFYSVFLYSGVQVIEKTLVHRREKNIAQCLFLLWPLHFILAFRVNNDVPFYAFCTLSLLAWISYVEKPTLRHLCLAVGLTSLSLVIKFNTAILAFTILAVLWTKRKSVMDHLKQGFKKERILLALLLLMPLAALGVGPFYSAYKASALPQDPGIYGAQGLGGARLYANNKVAAYTLPATSGLIETPFVYSGNAESRQNVWGYLLKTMVFAEFTYPNVALARAILIALCIMASIVVLYFLTLTRKDVVKNQNVFLNILFFVSCIIGILFFRAQYNQTAAQDFRYIVPGLIPFIVAWSIMVSAWYRKGFVVLSILGYGSALAVVVSGYIFYGQYFYHLI